MLVPSDNRPSLKSRKQVADTVLHAMARFPRVLEILGELGKSDIPAPGDEDIRRGCDRAVTAILVDLARIEPAPPGIPCQAEEATYRMLNGEAGVALINPDKLQSIHELVSRIFGPSAPARPSQRGFGV